MLSIQTNVTSLFAQQALAQNQTFESKTIQQLTSGYRINSSGDDAAGLAVANQYRANVAQLQQGVLNASNASTTLQIIDGGLNNISQILDRLQTLARSRQRNILWQSGYPGFRVSNASDRNWPSGGQYRLG